MEEVAQGDLTGSVRIAGGGDLGRLGDSITETIANLRDIIGRVDESFLLIERVATDLAGLSEAVADGARREEQVVGTLGGTTASLSGPPTGWRAKRRRPEAVLGEESLLAARADPLGRRSSPGTPRASPARPRAPRAASTR